MGDYNAHLLVLACHLVIHFNILVAVWMLPCLLPVGLWYRGFLVNHLSRDGDDVVFDELLANVLNV